MLDSVLHLDPAPNVKVEPSRDDSLKSGQFGGRSPGVTFGFGTRTEAAQTFGFGEKKETADYIEPPSEQSFASKKGLNEVL
jgi:hypothetical protein